MQKNNKKAPRPPLWPQRFLEWFCPEELYEGVAGDLVEKFEAEATFLGMKKARRNFTWGVIRFFRPYIILRNRISFNLTNTTMLKNYLIVATRTIRRNKTNSFVNVLGLSLGIVCVLIIAMVIRYELSFDSYHSDADRIYRVVRVSQVEGQTEYRTGVATPLPYALRDGISTLRKVTAMNYHRNAQVDVIGTDGNTIQKFQEDEGCAFVDETFFKVFDFREKGFGWLAGNPASALKDPYAVVLTRSIAEKYFQSTQVLGKTLKLEKMLDLKVTGVIEDLPENTDFPFKILISYATLQQFRGDEFMTNWYSVSDVNQCYIVLPPNMGKGDMEQQMAQLHAANVSRDLSESRVYRLQPLKEVHSDIRFGNYNLRVVSTESIWALGIIGGFLLIMVCINFINLSTAHAINRAREVGIRKVMGGKRRHVAGQSLTETMLIIGIASVVALMAGTLILKKTQSLIGFEIPVALYEDSFVWICLLVLATVTTGLAGLYPALVLSRYKPVQAIRKNLNTQSHGGFQLRRILLISQFTIMQILIIATFITVKQMHFFKNVSMGFNKEAIINVQIPESGADKSAPREDKLSTFRNELLSSSFIDNVSFSSSLPSGLKRPRWFRGIRRKTADKNEDLVYEYQSVDHQYLDLFDIKLLSGRNFKDSDGADVIIINETLCSKLGFADPLSAIDNEVMVVNETFTVIGVMQDFYTNSFKEDFDKVALRVIPRSFRLASIKLNIPDSEKASYQNLEETLHLIREKWEDYFPENVFTYSFLDENIEAFYEEEARLSRLFQLFSLVFLVIGCLGLYGLVSFLANKKTKEVAVRKVLGASVGQILALFSKDYVRQIALAFVIAVPVSYYFMNEWLNSFAHHITLSWWFFAAPGIFVLLAALLSVGGKTWKSATANPADNLRNE